MIKAKTTKRALFLSFVSMFLCFTMLLGTTYAWFTDTVTSGINTIVAGNLDVELYYQAEGQTDWTKVTESTNVFKEDTLWEPGHTEVVKLKIVNEGTLALKYTLGVKVASEIASVNMNGDELKLSDHIKFGIVDGAQSYTRDEAIAAVDATATALKSAYNSDATQLPAKNDTDSDEKIVTLVVYMPTSVGNEANYKKDAIVPQVDLGINLFATQDTVESDSFDNLFDKMAIIDTEAKLLEALAGDYDLIKLGSNIELTAGIEIPAGKTVAIDLNGHALSQTKLCTESYSMIANNGTLTINDSVGGGKVSFTDTGAGGSSAWATYTIRNNGTLTVNGGTIEHLGNQEGNAINAIFSYNGDTTINGGNILCPYSRSVRQWQGTLTINGGTFDGQVWVQAQADCTTTITGGSFKPGSKGNDSSSVFVTNDTYTVNLSITDGNFATKLGMSSAVKCVKGGTFGIDPSAYVVDGMKAVQVGDTYEVIANSTTYATASTAAELQAALDNAANVNLIVLTADIEGDVTVKQIENRVITVDGDGHKYAGVFLIDGNSAQEATSGVTLKDINFKADTISADACIQLGNGTTVTRYTCNVTVENCTFDVPGAVGVKSYTGGDKNLKIVDCKTTATLHSLAQLKGINGVLVDKCTVNSVRGINFNNSLNITVQESTFDVQKYALRFGESANTTVENYAIINSTLTSDCLDGDAVIVLRAGATNANLTITNSTYTGSLPMSGHDNANVVIN